MSIHRKILKESWKITFQKKYLWFFGLFAAFFCGISSFEITSNLFFGNSEILNFKKITETGILSFNFYINLSKLFLENPFHVTFVLFIVLLVTILFIFIIWLSVISQSAIINNVANIKLKEKDNFQQGIKIGIKNFWPVFSLNAFIRFTTFLCFTLLNMDVIIKSAERDLLANFIYSILFVFCISFLIIFSFIVNYGISYIIIKKETFLNSIKDAIKLFQKNWLVTLEMGFLLYVINFIIALITFLIILITTIPLLLFAFILINSSSTIFFSFIIVLAILLLFFISLFFISFIVTFQTTANTLLFIELLTKGGVSKIVRVFSKS